MPRFLGVKLGPARAANGEDVEVEVSLETAPSALWDALIIVGGEDAADALSASGQALEFLKDQYRHCKPILLIGGAGSLLEKAGIPAADCRRRIPV